MSVPSHRAGICRGLPPVLGLALLLALSATPAGAQTDTDTVDPLVPTDDPGFQVQMPEPSSLVLMASAAGALFGVRLPSFRRRRKLD